MSIGLTTTRSRSRSQVEELAHRARSRATRWPDERVELGRRAPDGERHQASARAVTRPAGEGGVEGVGDDVEVGQLGHGRAIVPT